MPVPVARSLSTLGIAKETTPGTGVAATNFIRYTPGTLKPVNRVNYLRDEGQRGAMVDVYDVRPGTTFGETSWGGPVFPDELGWILAGHLGDVVTTGASAPYSHAIAIKNNGQPPKNYSLSDQDGVDTQRYTGQVFPEFGLKWSADGTLEYTTKTVGWAPDTPANPTFSTTTVTIVPAWTGVFTIGGSASTMMLSGELSSKRAGQAVHTHNNTQSPAFTFMGAVAVTGKFTFAMADNSEMTRYLTNTQPAVTLDWQQGAGAALTEVKCVMTKCAYTQAIIDRGKDFSVVEVTFTALGNTTDVGASAGYSPCKWTLQNQLAANTYV